jgi:hypothetical protein
MGSGSVLDQALKLSRCLSASAASKHASSHGASARWRVCGVEVAIVTNPASNIRREAVGGSEVLLRYRRGSLGSSKPE